ncbi:hypothetical protein J6590_032655 [Homalodisca vitripennis]|nr:hypothetical protein J6590_032655 [Homalodisca vitripennis]
MEVIPDTGSARAAGYTWPRIVGLPAQLGSCRGPLSPAEWPGRTSELWRPWQLQVCSGQSQSNHEFSQIHRSLPDVYSGSDASHWRISLSRDLGFEFLNPVDLNLMSALVNPPLVAAGYSDKGASVTKPTTLLESSQRALWVNQLYKPSATKEDRTVRYMGLRVISKLSTVCHGFPDTILDSL